MTKQAWATYSILTCADAKTMLMNRVKKGIKPEIDIRISFSTLGPITVTVWHSSPAALGNCRSHGR